MHQYIRYILCDRKITELIKSKAILVKEKALLLKN